jgi:hypothetical protein
VGEEVEEMKRRDGAFKAFDVETLCLVLLFMMMEWTEKGTGRHKIRIIPVRTFCFVT